VNGENTAPVYKFLKTAKSSGLLGSLLGDNVKWNFEKFLVDKNGQVVQRYSPTVAPLKIEVRIRIV
jgi:glutathione peroxidase